MQNNDIEIIHRILDGNDAAFAELVNKYHRSVHALVWRKIEDFHIAEELTQDIFLKVYHKLNTLKKPHCFASWLYVIASRRCTAWLRKKRMLTQPIEDSTDSESGKSKYSKYVIEENERTATEAQREIVRKLLAKLPESERTVVTLRYFSDMSSAEIGAFLGVSANTVRSRLRRARNRLQKEETMIREALEHFQISPNLTDNIMQEISQTKQVAPTAGKPLIPWIVGVTAVTIVLLMLGFSNQFLSRFQKPYSLEAQSEMSVELVEAPIVQEIDAQPNVRRQFGNTPAVRINGNSKQIPNEVFLAGVQAEEEDVSIPKQQWIQSAPLTGSAVQSLLSTPKGDLYTYARGDIFKLPANADKWQHVFDISTLNHSGFEDRFLLKKWNNVLYYTQSSDLFTSKDDGKTWDLLYSWDNNKYYYAIELILTAQAFYMAFQNGVFISEDSGRTWKEITERVPREIWDLVETQNTLFAGTENGFYRLDTDGWKRIEFPVSIEWVSSVTVTEERLYVLAELDYSHPRKVSRGLERGWGVFRSSDLGNSWEDITPTNAWAVNGFAPQAKLIAVGETLLLMEKGMVRSTDGGNTWIPPQLPGTSPEMNSMGAAVVVNKDTIYIGSNGLHRSIDKGKSWEIINITPDESGIDHLITFNKSDSERNLMPTLYARLGSSIVTTSDQGKSWINVQVEIPMTEPHREEPPSITHIVNYGDVIYAKGGGSPFPPHSGDSFGRIKTLLYRVTKDGNTLVPVQGMPFFDLGPLQNQLSEKRGPFFDASDKEYVKQLQEKAHGATQFFEQLAKWDPHQPDVYMQSGFRTGPFAVSNDTFYVEYNYKLFRWKLGETEWYDTGLEETVELTLDIAKKDLKLSVSGDTVYVGKRDGRLVVSFDKGTNWIELTSALPFPFKTFKEIVFAGSTIYVATDAGVAASDSGKNWRAITDAEGTNLIMDMLTVDGTTLYGVIKDTGIYRLESGTWENVVSKMPKSVTSLAVDGKTLYVGTETQGMLHYTLE